MSEIETKPVASIGEYLANAKESFTVFRWIWREITTAQSRRKLCGMFLALGIFLIIQSCQPWAVSRIITGLIDRNQHLIISGIILTAFCLFAERLSCQFRDRAREWVLGLHWCRLDQRITELFFEKSIGQHIHEGTMLSVSHIDKGRWKLLDMQGMIMFEGLPALAEMLIAFCFLMTIAWMAGVVMTAVIMIYLFWSLYLNYKVNQEMTPVDRDSRALNRYRVERWERVERVKVCGKEIEETDDMTKRFDEIMSRDRKFWFWYISSSNCRGLFNDLGVVLIHVIGAWQVWNGNWSIGFLYPLFMWTNKVASNIWRIGSIEQQISWNLPSVKSMVEALKIPPAIVKSPGEVTLDSGRTHRIEFENVSHIYPRDTKRKVVDSPAIVNVCFSIEPGEKVALLGISGSGKSTTSRNLLRFDDPTSGRILVGGVDLRNISQTSWYRGIGYIPQQTQVFDGTIRYNLCYRMSSDERQKITDEKLWELMRLLQIDFKDRLTDGLDTVVGKNGIKLSGGQAQRLMIGSAVINRPWLLVIDEATSSLDSMTEHEVQEGLSKVLSGSETSALIVAHRLSTVRRLCSKFVVLKSANEVRNGDSQVEAVAGSFETLYEISPTFRRLADYQGVKIV